jgi:hypothetical protein
MVLLTPTRGQAMVHCFLVLVQLGQHSTFNHTWQMLAVTPVFAGLAAFLVPRASVSYTSFVHVFPPHPPCDLSRAFTPISLRISDIIIFIF